MKTYEPLSPPRRILLGPGPSDVHPRVLNAMAAHTVGHLDPYFLKIMDDTKELLRWLFQTKNDLTIPISATGSAGMETCFANIFERGDKVIIGVNGVFGKRMTETARKFGLEVVRLEKEWGDVFSTDEIKKAISENQDAAGIAVVHAETSTGACQPLEEIGKLCKENNMFFLVDAVTSLGGIPLKVDDWGIDACYSGTQKCLSCPPGLSPVTFSPKAVEKIMNRKTEVESWYLDLSMIQKYWTESDRAYHHTAPINAVYGLREALIILHEEGLESLHKRHKFHSDALLAGLKAIGINSYVKDNIRLPELNSVTIPDGVNEAEVRSILLNKYNLEIGAGLGPLAGKIWRIGLMGQSSCERNVIYLLSSIEQILFGMGKLNSCGNAVKAAQEFYN